MQSSRGQFGGPSPGDTATKVFAPTGISNRVASSGSAGGGGMGFAPNQPLRAPPQPQQQQQHQATVKPASAPLVAPSSAAPLAARLNANDEQLIRLYLKQMPEEDLRIMFRVLAADHPEVVEALRGRLGQQRAQ